MRNEPNAIKFVAAKLANQGCREDWSVDGLEKNRSESQQRSLNGTQCVVLGSLSSQLIKPT